MGGTIYFILFFLQSIFFIIFIVPVPRQENKFSFQPIFDDTGLYFEKIAPDKLFNDEWHIVYHMNLSALQNEFEVIQTTVKALAQLCQQILEQTIVIEDDDIEAQ